jgi:hypothetical protein
VALVGCREGVKMAYNKDTMSFDVPDTDMVYVEGLPLDITEAEIAQHFGSIGVLKQDKKKGGPKIWLYRDKASGALKVWGPKHCQTSRGLWG